MLRFNYHHHHHRPRCRCRRQGHHYHNTSTSLATALRKRSSINSLLVNIVTKISNIRDENFSLYIVRMVKMLSLDYVRNPFSLFLLFLIPWYYYQTIAILHLREKNTTVTLKLNTQLKDLSETFV